jgi:hypothetical protein
MPGGGFDAGFDAGFDIGTDQPAIRLPTWFRGEAKCEARPANVMREARPANVACEASGWISAGGGLPMPPLEGALLFENADNIQLESGSGVLLLG